MKKVKDIPRPNLPDAHVLTAPELNKIRLSDRHTVLTPELLAKVASQKGAESAKQNPDTSSTLQK